MDLNLEGHEIKADLILAVTIVVCSSLVVTLVIFGSLHVPISLLVVDLVGLNSSR